MDFHFAIADEPQSKKPASFKFLKTYLPLFVIALFLPFLLFFTINSQSFNLASKADSSNDMNVWFDPSTYQMQTGESVTVNIMASTQRNDLIHGIKIIVPRVDGLNIQPAQIEYPQAFSGKVILGEITVTALRSGSYSLNLPSEAVETGVENSHITTSPATIVVSSR